MNTIRQTVAQNIPFTDPGEYAEIIDACIVALEERERKIRAELTQEAQAVDSPSEEVQAAFDRAGLGVTEHTAQAEGQQV